MPAPLVLRRFKLAGARPLTAGQPVNLMVSNEGQALDDFTLEAAAVHVNVDGGQRQITSIVLDEPGVYRAICTEPGQEQAGMVADIVGSE